MIFRILALFSLLTLLLFAQGSDSNKTSYALFSKEKKIEKPSRLISFSYQRQHSLDEEELQDAVGVETKKFFEFWSDKKPTIGEKLLPTLEASLRSYLDSVGFYDATFSVKKTDREIAVSITENQPVKIYDINITSDFDIKEAVTFEKGEIFSTKEFVAIKGAIIEKLLNEGYCSYDLESKAYVDLDLHRVDLKYHLKKNGVCTFGKVSIKGGEKIKDGVILSRVRAREGRRFDKALISQSYEALYALDAFEMVTINYDRKFYNVVPVDMEVAETTKPWYFIGGVGYDTNVGPRVQAEITRKNFLGDAKKLKLRLQYSQLEQLAETGLFVPALFDIKEYYIDLFATVGYSNLEYTGFMEKKSYTEVYLAYTNEILQLKAGFSLENIDISLLEEDEEEELTQAITPGNFLLAYPFFGFVYDGRDSKLNPKYGFYFSADVEYGLHYSEDASSYLKYMVEGRAIYTFGDLTTAAVAKGGVVDEITNRLPESKLFFAGGTYTNRAYGFERVGVIFSPTRYGIDGGLTMANLSLEADYPVWGDIYGAVFTDNTMLTINSYDFSGDILSSAGIGVRYMTPIGPISLNAAANVRDVSQYGIQFLIGQSF